MNQSTNAQQAHMLLRQRLYQDAARDPVDALADAKMHYQILLCIHNVLHDPTTRYVLAQRIREDLVREDLAAALSEAQQLATIQRNRVDDLLETSRC